MDRHECRVISDATSVQPLCRTRVDLSIVGLVAEAVEAEVAVEGVEEDLRRRENRARKKNNQQRRGTDLGQPWRSRRG